ncbi:MAG: hypothetical protein Phog2KO_33380 [Phototrophicaceae bacterium]
MDNFNNEYNVMAIHKSREQELIAQAENERKAKTLRETLAHRVRRVISKTNNPIR